VAIEGGKKLSSLPGRFITGEKSTATHFVGVWEVPGVIMDVLQKRKSVVVLRIETRILGRPSHALY
jgi:hypothetical protein